MSKTRIYLANTTDGKNPFYFFNDNIESAVDHMEMVSEDYNKPYDTVQYVAWGDNESLVPVQEQAENYDPGY